VNKLALQRKVHRQELLLRAVEQRTDFVVKGYTSLIENLARQAFLKGKTAKVPASDQTKFTNRIVDLMLLGFVKRYEYEKDTLPRSISLSFQDDVAKLAQDLELDLGNVRNGFTQFAKKRVNGAFVSLESRINNILADVTAKQLPTRQGIREFNRELTKAGIAVRKPALLETLVRTHAQVAMGAAQWQLDQDDPEDLISGYVYSTVGDDRVRDEHWELEGVVFKKGDSRLNELWPPNGWNCRCQLVSVIGELPKGKRATNAMHADEGFDFHPGKLLLGKAA
jgi:SPP1 gp7 family putative phage head morphogenesis protein